MITNSIMCYFLSQYIEEVAGCGGKCSGLKEDLDSSCDMSLDGRVVLYTLLNPCGLESSC